MASIAEMLARAIDLFGPVGAASPSKLYGNLMVSPNGNVLVGTTADNDVQKLQVNGSASVSGYLARKGQIAFGIVQYYYNIENFAANQAIVMGSSAYWPGTTVLANVGGAFNPANGAFTAPVAGDYVFNASLTTSQGDTYLEFYINGVGVGMQYLVYSAAGDWSTAAATLIFSLNAGDFVQCVAASNNSTTALGYGNTFGGFLI
jgi:hypothetical protein